MEESGVEEVGAYAFGFELERAELEDAACDAGLEEVGFVGGDGGFRGGVGHVDWEVNTARKRSQRG